MIYNGMAMHHSFEGGSKNGKIHINQNTITFKYTGGEQIFPLEGIEISYSRSGKGATYLRHPLNPEWCFYSDDREIKNDSVLVNTPSGKRALSHSKSTNRILITLAMTFVLIFAMLIGCFFIFKDKIIYKIASTIPVEWEQEAGESMFKSITSDKKLLKDSAITAEVNKLGSFISKAVNDPKYKFKFYIIEDSTLNAFALPGGNIVIHSGLLLNAKNAEEVLGVLGHEIAHVTQRHHARNIISEMGFNFIIKAFIGFDSDVANLIANAGSTLQSLKYSRDLESEADNKGWQYLVNANINPKGMISFFEKLEQQNHPSEEIDGTNLSFLSTHPATKERIKNLEEKLSTTLQKKDFPNVPFEFKNFQDNVRSELN